MAKKLKIAEETQEVATTAQQPAAPALSKQELADWGVAGLTSRDVMIPKVLAMQAMSKPVVAGEAKFGELRESLNNTVVGAIDRPMEFIPFYMEKCFVVMRKVNGTMKFNRQVPIVPANENQAYEATDADGNEEKWYRTMNFYCLKPGDRLGIPFMLSFRSSSARAGQKIATTMFMRNIKAGKPPAATVMELSCTKESNDKGTYIVMDAKEKRPSTVEEIADAFEWVKTVRSGQAKADHSDLEQEAAGATEAPVSTEY